MPQADTDNPLYGVRGWLKFFVVVQKDVAPVPFVMSQVAGFVDIGMIARRYPGLVVVGVIEAVVGSLLILKWILLARQPRDGRPRIVQDVKKWLWITLGVNLFAKTLINMAGMDPEQVMPDALKGLLAGIVGFTVWFSYLNTSKRVEATYLDWDQ